MKPQTMSGTGRTGRCRDVADQRRLSRRPGRDFTQTTDHEVVALLDAAGREVTGQ